MAITDYVGRFSKNNINIWLTTAIGTAPTSTPTFAFKNIGLGPWPRANNPLVRRETQASSIPMRQAEDYHLGINMPQFSLQLPFTAKTLAFGALSVLQNKTVAASTDLTVATYSDPQAKWFFGLECTFGANAGRQVYGCVVKKMTVTIPPVGNDGGQPTITLDCIGAAAARINATTGTTTVDTTAEYKSTDWGFQIGGASKKMVSAQFSIDNGAAWGPNNAGTTPDQINLSSSLEVAGNVKVAMSVAADDEWDAFNDNYAAATQLVLKWVTGSTYFTGDFLIDEPGEPEEQGNVIVTEIPLVGVYESTSSPQFYLDEMATSFTTWS